MSNCVWGSAFIAVTVVNIFIRVFAGEGGTSQGLFLLEIWHKMLGKNNGLSCKTIMSTNTLQTQSMQNIKTYKADGWSWSWINGWSNHEESSSFLTTAEDISQAFHRDSTTWTPGKARRLQKNQDFHVQEQVYNFLTARIQRTSSEIRGHLLIRH